MLDFIQEYWQYLSFGLLVILDVIVLIVKRLKLQLKIPSSSYSFLVGAISDAEDIYGAGHGKEKLNYVVELYFKHFEIPKVFEMATKEYISGVIESILSTPHKKSTDE